MAISERNLLAGGPSNVLIRRVRQTLWLYLRCRPHRDDKLWRETWEWAAEVAGRSSLWGLVPGAKRRAWPLASEIASQYVFLALVEMRSSSQLRLPYSAAKYMPASIAQRFAAVGGQQGGVLPTIEYTGSAPATAGERPDLTT